MSSTIPISIGPRHFLLHPHASAEGAWPERASAEGASAERSPWLWRKRSNMQRSKFVAFVDSLTFLGFSKEKTARRTKKKHGPFD